MSSLLPPELAALADRSDIDVSVPDRPETGRLGRMRQLFVSIAIFAGATLFVAVILFVPVLVSMLGRVQGVLVDGEIFTMPVFLDQLAGLFFGTCILALAFTSFITLVQRSANDVLGQSEEKSGIKNDAFLYLNLYQMLGGRR